LECIPGIGFVLNEQSPKRWFAHPNIWTNLIAIATLASFLLPLALYCVVGLYTRYVADDYETAGSLNKYGFWGSQRFWYLNWSGRYAYFVVVNLFQLLGVQAAPALTTIILILWLAAMGWLIYQLLRIDAVSHPAYLAILLSALTLVVTLRSMAHIHQILFWVTGILTYATYLVLLTICAGCLVYRFYYGWRFTWLEIIVAAAYVFILTGMSEVSAALQVLLAGMGMTLFVFWRSDPQKRPAGLRLFSALLVSTLIGFALLFSAPGNVVRSALVEPRPGLYPLVLNANINAVMFIASWLKDQTLLAGIALFMPALLSFTLYQPSLSSGRLAKRERAILRGMLISVPLLYLLVLFTFATGYYALSGNLPDRAQIVPQYFLILTIVLWGYWSGSLLKGLCQTERALPAALKLVGVILLGLMLLYGPLYASAYNYTMIEPARVRAVEWDERDHIIRQAIQAGERRVVVWYIRDLNRLGDYSSDPEFLVNRAAADYYGLDSIIALDERP
jgi:hypothetical protein